MSSVTVDNKAFYTKLKTISLPIIFQSLMLALVAAGDALMLGRVAQEEMTAVSLATQVQFVQNMFLMAITAAGSILGAQYWGKGDMVTLQKIFNLMLRFTGLVSAIFFVACELVPEMLMKVFASDSGLIEIGASYLRIAGWSYLMTGISQSYLAVMKVTDHVTPSAWISSSAVVFNILLNAIFIFGLLGMPRMQARGAALATTLARLIELGLCIGISLKKDYIRPNLKKLLAMENHSFRSICSFFDYNSLPFSIAIFFNPKIILITAFNTEIVVIDHFERHQVQFDIFIK